MGRLRTTLLFLLASLCALFARPATAAQPPVKARPESFKVLSSRPAAVEGAPILLPIRWSEPPPEGRVAAPIRLEFRGANDALVARGEAQVCWPVRPDDGASEPNRWATASNALRLAAPRPAAATDAYLVLEPPPEVRSGASIVIGPHRVEPSWYPAPDPALLARIAGRASTVRARMPLDPLASLPDPRAPFERFRFAIGRSLREWPAPAPFASGSPEDLAARATTALWLAALSRVAEASEATAVEIAEALVGSADDAEAGVQVAAWIADPADISSLLALALDRTRSVQASVDALASWVRQRTPVIVWVDDDALAWVGVAIANPLPEEAIVRISWLGGDDAPLATVVPAASVVRARIARRLPKALGDGPPPRAPAESLVVAHREETKRVVGPPSVLSAGAAGPAFGTFLRPLDLVGIATGGAQSAPDGHRTRASLRPRLDGWEIFVEAFSPPGSSVAEQGRVVVVGPGGSAVEVGADGTLRDPGGILGEGASLRFAAYPDRFRASFLVPPAWIDRSGGETMVTLAFRRESAAGRTDAVFPTTPWRRLPRPVRIDLFGGG